LKTEAEYSAFESTLNSAIVSYRIVFAAAVGLEQAADNECIT